MEQGWIAVYRRILEGQLWKEKPFSRAQAWIDLLLIANYRDGTIWVRNIPVPVKRGQVGWSQIRLAGRWGWSRGKVRRFLEYLENESQIVQHTIQQSERLTTIITLKNYEKYNQGGTTNTTTDGQQTDNRRYSNEQGNKGKKNTKTLSGKPDLTHEVIKYINQALGTNYKPTTKKTKSLVATRANEGHTLQDFKTVIDKKAAEWKNDPENAKYLRPETLFGTKFEGYLNQLEGKKGFKSKEVEKKEHIARLKKGIAEGKDGSGRTLIDVEIKTWKNELYRITKYDNIGK